MENEVFFQGEVSDAVIFPFAMREWEQRRVLRYWPVTHLTSRDAAVDELGAVTEWRDSSGNANNAIAKAVMPRWFRAWLWLRSMYARL